MTSRKGTSREHYIANKFKKEGYTTMRKYASIGLYDFIAFKRCLCMTCLTFFSLHTQMLIIQVKGDPWDKPDKEGLIKEAKKVGARPVLVYREIRASMIGKDKKKW